MTFDHHIFRSTSRRAHRPIAAVASVVACICALSACPTPTGTGPEPEPEPDVTPTTWPLGVHENAAGTVGFAVMAPSAERVHLEIFAQARDSAAVLTRVMVRDGEDAPFIAEVSAEDLEQAGLDAPLMYGYRAFGPNWPFDESWAPGTEAGFLSDVDDAGNRYNPNKLLVDPYAREMSHDPLDATHDWTDYASGPEFRNIDTAPFGPKSVYLSTRAPSSAGDQALAPSAPARPLADEVVYEVHVKGFTIADDTLDAAIRGTYAGAGERARYLKDIGVTAVEFLPVHEAPNDQNEIDPNSADGDNYWGYNTMNFFSPDRRYAADKSLGGPTGEFRAMVQAFHNEGIKVFLDVVYNHTAENPPWGDNAEYAPILSFRGLDNTAYYQLAQDARYYANHNGVSANFSATHPVAQQVMLDSLAYWRSLGVDGFRVDLAALHGNGCERDCFNWAGGREDGLLVRAAEVVGATIDGERAPDESGGGHLLAEPWGAADGTYQLGQFPMGWAQWNDKYRDTFRSDINQLFVADVAPGELATRFAGSSDVMSQNGPGFGINFITAHDGFTLRDLVSCNEKQNDQPWPNGPSDGGSNSNRSWDHGGDETAQQQAARTLMTTLFLSRGTPMVYGGDERWRTKACNNNTYNLDSPATALDWTFDDDADDMRTFFTGLTAFRAAHPVLRQNAFFAGEDTDENGLKDITWMHDSGVEAWGEYFDDINMHFLGYRIDAEGDGNVRSLYVGYNGWEGNVSVTMPEPADGHDWWLVIDTGSMRTGDNVLAAPEVVTAGVDAQGRSLFVAVEATAMP